MKKSSSKCRPSEFGYHLEELVQFWLQIGIHFFDDYLDTNWNTTFDVEARISAILDTEAEGFVSDL